MIRAPVEHDGADVDIGGVSLQRFDVDLFVLLEQGKVGCIDIAALLEHRLAEIIDIGGQIDGARF